MAHRVVKILSSDDGEKIPKNEQVWHLVSPMIGDGSDRTFCGGEAFGHGESACTFETKRVEKAGITCKDCLVDLQNVKNIKL